MKPTVDKARLLIEDLLSEVVNYACDEQLTVEDVHRLITCVSMLDSEIRDLDAMLEVMVD